MPIGDFKDPDEKEDESIQGERKGQETPAKRMVDGIQANMETMVSTRENSAEKAEDWRDRLKSKGISLEKAHSIIDDLLTKGYYEESFDITSRVSVTFRTRSQYDFQRYMRALDIVNPRFNDEMQEIAMRYFVAASLVRFKDKEFEHPELAGAEGKASVDAAFEERMDWVEKQPAQLVVLLSQKLHAFDEMIAAIFSEGVIENF